MDLNLKALQSSVLKLSEFGEHLVSNQQEALDQFVCVANRWLVPSLSGSLLLGFGYQTVARLVVETIPGVRHECHRCLYLRRRHGRYSRSPAVLFLGSRTYVLSGGPLRTLFPSLCKSGERVAAVRRDLRADLLDGDVASVSQGHFSENLTVEGDPKRSVFCA